LTRSQVSAVALAAIAALAPIQSAGAQLGGLIKKKVSEAIKPAEKAVEPAARPGQQQSLFNADVMQITPASVASMRQAMATERSMQDEFRRELAKYPTREQYAECQQKAAISPEGQKIVAVMGNMPENATPEEHQRIITKMGTDMEALVKKLCPLNPDDWQDYKKRERVVAIHRKASSPFDTIGVRGVSGDGVSELSARRNDILTERIVAYCEAKKAGADVSGDADGLKIPGTGRDIYWVYTAEELKVLATIDCDKFLAEHRALTM
jgi:hypothetical protein